MALPRFLLLLLLLGGCTTPPRVEPPPPALTSVATPLPAYRPAAYYCLDRPAAPVWAGRPLDHRSIGARPPGHPP